MNREKLCKTDNEMELIFDALSANESLARVAVAAFATEKNPTLEELSDIKTAVSEAVTNAIIHGYGNDGKRNSGNNVLEASEVSYDCQNSERKKVRMHCSWLGKILIVEIEDRGIGIADVEQAMEPLFTTKPDQERSGMGFSFMEAFMDELEVESTPGQGTLVIMKKEIGCNPWICEED